MAGRGKEFMDTVKETRMTAAQLEMLLEYLPDGVLLEISWEGADGETAE